MYMHVNQLVLRNNTDYMLHSTMVTLVTLYPLVTLVTLYPGYQLTSTGLGHSSDSSEGGAHFPYFADM